MIDQLLQGTAAYLDDNAIYSQSWEELLLHLKHVLWRIKSADLTLRPDKCFLAKQEI